MVELKGISMMFIALGLLVVPGFLYNNLNNTGLIQPSQALTCPGWPDVTCQGSVSAGCQSSSAYCTLSGQTISFLNFNSPFTSLLTGNLLGFFSNLFPPSGQQTVYTAQPQWSADAYVPTSFDETGHAWCSVVQANQNIITNPVSSFIYGCNILSNDAGTSYKFYSPPSGPNMIGPAFINPVLNPGTPGNPVVNGTTFLPALNGAPLLIPNGGNGYYIFSSTLLSTTFNSTFKYEFKVHMFGWTSTGASANPLNYLSIIGFIVGLAILIFLALGIGFESGALTFNFGITNNRQGTKFAQVLLIGLIVWIPMYSEFSTWFTSSILPYGFDGALGIISILVTGLWWFGTYSWATTD